MCDFQWNALAEFHLFNKDFPEEIYCLCSRVFTWSFDGIGEELSASESDFLKKDESNAVESPPNYESTDTVKHCGETEPLSCYCSASHTDNISTDEHDSLRDSHASNQRLLVPKALHLSDSGADLTEYCSNSAWQKYWSFNGERLIWESWIAKYSAYINPGYLQASQEQQLDDDCAKDKSHEELHSQDKTEGINSLKFSFDSLSPRQDSSDCSATACTSLIYPPKENLDQKAAPAIELVEKNRMLIRNLSYSDSYDKLNREVEGWNPLSPVSNDCETEAERLLSSRCASRTGSSARTVDSMTNVTRMTVSSIDLSESSKNSDSFSSVSSVQSSMTSSSDDAEESVDYEHQWSALWMKHYEQEYLEHYTKFIADNIGRSTESTDEAAESINDCDIEENSGDGSTPKTSVDLDEETSKSSDKVVTTLTSTTSEQTLVDADKTNVKRRRRRGKAKRISTTDTNVLTAVLNLMKMEDNPQKTSDSCKSDVDVDLPLHSSNINTMENKATEQEALGHAEYLEQISQMNLMGLPLSFKSKDSQPIVKGQHVKKPITLKYSSEEDDTDQSSSNRVKAAFTLIGIEMHEGTEAKFKGSIDYKMKHIRTQNRGLKFYKCTERVVKPKHTHFDDDGFVVPENCEPVEVTVQNSHQDELLGIIPSSSTEDEMEPAVDEVQHGEADKLEESRSTRKKRKRKINLPPELKDNPKLRKYWQRRYSLFSNFDQGIKLDEESWFSVTPELIAKNTAERCRCDVLIDAFCGAGGNAIQFAFSCNKVIAIDIDPKKIELAQHNAEVYGVANQIEFITGDFFQLADGLKADVVFLSPPWGGPEYLSQPTYDLEMLQPAPFTKLLSTARKITENISLFLPKNSNTYPLVRAAGPGGNVELEQNFLGKRLVAITAYYGDLIKESP